MEREPEGTLITLVDEESKEEKEFEFLASLENDGVKYVALIPAFMEPEELVESDGELVILKVVKNNDDEDTLISIDDDDEFDTVAAKFEDMLSDDFDIIGDDDMETNKNHPLS